MNISSSQSVLWDSVAGASSYTVELLNAAAGAVLAEFETPGTEIPATVLLADQSFGNYNVRVRAEEDAGPGAFSSLLPLTFVALSAPANLRVE